MSDYIYYKAVSSRLKDFMFSTNSLFKRLNKNGYIIFNMSSETKELIKEYGTTNIYEIIQDKKLWKKVVIDQRYKKFSDIRYSAFFIDIFSVKEVFGDDHPLLKIIISLQSDLSRIFDIRNNDNYAEAITILYSLKSSSDIQGLHTDYDPKIKEKKQDNHEPAAPRVGHDDFKDCRHDGRRWSLASGLYRWNHTRFT
jgi:hypothetical protein